MKLLEVCVDSLASARAAKQGADRLEFCSALAVGGLMPDADLLRQIKAELDLPCALPDAPAGGGFPPATSSSCSAARLSKRCAVPGRMASSSAH